MSSIETSGLYLCAADFQDTAPPFSRRQIGDLVLTAGRVLGAEIGSWSLLVNVTTPKKTERQTTRLTAKHLSARRFQ